MLFVPKYSAVAAAVIAAGVVNGGGVGSAVDVVVGGGVGRGRPEVPHQVRQGLGSCQLAASLLGNISEKIKSVN